MLPVGRVGIAVAVLMPGGCAGSSKLSLMTIERSGLSVPRQTGVYLCIFLAHALTVAVRLACVGYVVLPESFAPVLRGGDLATHGKLREVDDHGSTNM